MAHLHTKPGQHDLTTSAFIVREVDGEWKCLVHMHRKLGALLQVGGHVELHETPWGALAHELEEESGYTLDELLVLQPTEKPLSFADAVVHPTPILVNTHPFGVGEQHNHTDLTYAFVARELPRQQPKEGESTDLRWLTLDELRAVPKDEILEHIVPIYTSVLQTHVTNDYQIPAESFSTQTP